MADNGLDQFTTWQNKKNPGIRHVWFDSIDNIIDCINAGEFSPECWGKRSMWSPWTINTQEGKTWAGAESMPAALDYLRYGWPEVAEAMYIQDAALALNRVIESEFEFTRSVTGGGVDIGAYVMGQPEDMVSFLVQERAKKTISILFNICASGGTSSKVIIERGHTVTSICDYLERSGFRVRIDVADTAYGYNSKRKERAHWTLAFCAKDYSQPLDFGRIGFMLGSPAMLRRIFFGVEAGSASWGADFGKTYGSVAPVHPLIGNKYDYVFDYQTPINIQNANKVVEYLVTGKATQVDTSTDWSDPMWEDNE